MQWFTWLERIVEHMCYSRQHEAPVEGHDLLSRHKDEDHDETAAWCRAEPHPLGGCMVGFSVLLTSVPRYFSGEPLSTHWDGQAALRIGD